MGFSRHDLNRNACMLTGAFKKKGYDWWWHSFTARNEKTGEEKPFFIEFFLCNPSLAEDEPTLGQLPANKAAGKKPSYLMVKAGTWGKDACQLHRFFPWRKVSLHKKAPYSVAAEDCFASDDTLKGHIRITESEAAEHPEYMCGYGEMSWHLHIKKLVPFNVGYGASAFFRAIKAFQMYWHAEGMKSEYCGEVIWNGEKYRVTPSESYGYADKNWGSDFTTPWVWLSSSDLVSRKSGKRLSSSVFDIGGGKPKVFFLSLPQKLLSAFYYEGKEYEFNFSKFWTVARTKFKCEETDDEIIWRVKQETVGNVMITYVRCKKSDMLLINYEAPSGEKKHNRLWNGGNAKGIISLYKKCGKKRVLIDSVYARHIGCEYGETDK